MNGLNIGDNDFCVIFFSQELESGIAKLLIPTPNATNKCGFNTDRYVLSPQARDYSHLKFLGILLGVAMRTRKPLDLHLAQPMWKLLAGMNLTPTPAGAWLRNT